MRISAGDNIKDPKAIREYGDLGEILEMLNYSESLEWKIEDLRSESDPDKKKEIKTTLHYIISAVFEPEERRNAYFKESTGMILDIDHIEDPISLKKKLSENKAVRFVFLSPSGDGLKVGVGFDKPVTDAEHYKKVYKSVAKKFQEAFGVEVDKTCDPARACFMSHDPDYHYNPCSIGVSTFVKEEEPEAKPYVPRETSSEDKEALAMAVCRELTISDYKDWVVAGMALKHEFGSRGLEMFLAMSMGKGYKDTESKLRWKWQTFSDSGSAAIGSFYHIAGRYLDVSRIRKNLTFDTKNV